MLKTAYFTFGQGHVHNIQGIRFDKDCVVEMVAYDPRQKMFDTFGDTWALEYPSPPDMLFFPRGFYRFEFFGTISTPVITGPNQQPLIQ